MQDPALLGLLLFLGAVVASRFLSERSLARLTPDEKVRVMDAFSTQRKYSLLVLVAIVLVLLLLGPAASGTVFFAVIALYAIGIAAYSFAKMRRLGMPSGYVRSFVAGQFLQLGGLAVYFAAISGMIAE